MIKEMSGIEQAVELAGSQTQLARQIGVTPQAVQQWVERGYVPPRRVPKVTEITGIPACLLNPESHLGLHGGHYAGHFSRRIPLEPAVHEQPARYHAKHHHENERNKHDSIGGCCAKDAECPSGAVD